MKPDILLLFTPHAVALQNDFAIYMNTKAKGHADIGQDLHDNVTKIYRISLNVHLVGENITTGLIDDLHFFSKNITGLKSFEDSEPQSIGWGEVIPLSFIPYSVLQSSKILIVSIPTRRHDQAKEMTNRAIWGDHIG